MNLRVIHAQEVGKNETPESWISRNRAQLAEDLRRDGAILFRGFPFYDGKDFERIVRAFDTNQTMMDYVGGTTPREKVTERVFTSTSTPSFMKIPLHSEMSYQAKFPRMIFFFCKVAPSVRGETPIADTRKIFSSLPDDVRSRFESRGVRYKRRLRNRVGFMAFLSRLLKLADQQTWQGAFKTEDRNAVEKHCLESYTSHSWLPDGSLVIQNDLPAIRIHPDSGEKVWFNQMHFSKRHSRVYGIFPALVSKVFSWMGFTGLDQSTYGDGSSISESDLVAVMDAMDKNRMAFRWQQGDVLALDNLLMAHGRNSFRGPREILVGMLG